MKKILLVLLFLVNGVQASEVYATFNVMAQKSANLAFSAGGIVEAVYVDNASVVTKSQKLAKLQNSDLKAALDVAKANVQSAEVSLKFAKKDYERQLKVKSVIDEAMFDKYAANYEKAKAALAQAKANVAYKQSLLDKTILRAPFDGVVYAKALEVGDALSGMVPKTVFTIENLHKRKLLLQYDQKYHNSVKKGQKFRYKIDGETREYEGVITKIYPFANSANRKIEAEVQADDVMVGLFGDGYIITDTKE